jgi:outer membrane lipoprotein-sorting protein
MSTHEQIKQLLTDYALRELPEEKSSEVKQHLADCKECRTEVKKLQAVLKCADSMRELSADEQVIDSAKESLLEAVANEQTKQTTTRPPIRLDLIWSTIMKSRITKLAAAAVIIIAILAALPFLNNGGHSITLAGVIDQMNKTNAYMYTLEMKITGKLMPIAQESKIRVVVSDEYGMKWYVDMIDPNSSKTTTQVIYVVPEQKMVVTLMPETKQYIRMPFGVAILERMKQQNNDPRVIIKQIMKCKYDELDRAVIDGVEVQGFRTIDPEFLSAIGSDATSIELTLWVDVENWLPFRSEMDIISGEQMQVTGATYDYRWNVPVQASDFDPVIPEDYKPFSTDGVMMPGMTEADAIEGLRLFAKITGRYPKKLNMMDVAQEITALVTDFENLPNLVDKLELKKLKDQMSQNNEMSEEEIRNTVMKKTMEMMRPLQSIGYFYMILVADKKEPVYYGEFVGPDDANKVLLKWKESDDHHRVIFGDLTTEDLTAEQWKELEQ